MSIYSRLQFNFDFPEGNELTLSNAAVKSLETFPPLLEDWQAKDIADNNVGGYFENKLANTIVTIMTTSSNIVSILTGNPSTNTNSVSGTTIEITNLFNNAAIALANVANNDINSNGEAILFLDHTDRISGIIELGSQPETGRDTSILPHFKTAIGIGRILTYLTYQTDNVSNTSVQTGSFTSLFVKNTISTYSTTLLPYPNLIANSITTTGSGTEMDPFVRTSNLSLSVVQTLATTANNIIETFKTRRQHDVNFYQNSRQILNEYGEVSYFTKTGETQTKLLTEVVGSSKLTSNTRIGTT
jgi:hypothetical protein